MRPSPAVRRSALVAALLALRAPALHAQELRGIVRDSAGSQPVPGVVLVLLDSTGRAIGRNLTNEHGAYRVALDPAMRRVRFLRIGFRPREVPLPALSGGSAQLDVTMAAIPTLLEPVRVVENPACRRRADGPAAFALWEQAKAALLATIVAREANPAWVVRYMFDRTLARDGRTVTGQTIRIDTATTTQPFAASESAADFAAHGFERDSAGIGIFFGPDAEVLLDDAFTAAYCFRLADREDARPNQVGIAFDAAKGKQGRIDIEGAVWVDTTSRALVDVEWQYTGLAYAVARYDPGGHVWFRAMPNGSVLIDHWYIRLPRDASGPDRTRYTRRLQVRETGGELGRARWKEGEEWQATLGTLHGTALLDGAPGAGLRVQLLDAPYSAITDSTGHFTITGLVPGPYMIGFVDSSLASIGLFLSAGAQFSAVRDSVTTLTVEAPTTEGYIAALCGDAPAASGNVTLVVRVRQQGGEPVQGATVLVRADRGDGVVRLVASGKSDERGLVHLCNAPPYASVFVTALRDGYGTGAAWAKMEHALTTVDIRVAPKP